jgi:hypothetical protein
MDEQTYMQWITFHSLLDFAIIQGNTKSTFWSFVSRYDFDMHFLIIYTVVEDCDHEVARALQIHFKVLPWTTEIEFCVVTGHQV